MKKVYWILLIYMSIKHMDNTKKIFRNGKIEEYLLQFDSVTNIIIF
jgi:hypothetical protein